MATDLVLGDGGIETDLIFHRGQDLPHFAAFVLLDTEEGREQLRAYYRPYVQIARDAGGAAGARDTDVARQPGLAGPARSPSDRHGTGEP